MPGSSFGALWKKKSLGMHGMRSNRLANRARRGKSPDTLDALIEECLRDEGRQESVPLGFAARVEQQIRLRQVIQRERRRVIRETLAAWGGLMGSGALAAGAAYYFDAVGLFMQLFPGGLGQTDSYRSAFFHQPLTSWLPLAGGIAVAGFLALLGGAVVANLPRNRPLT